jgi:uncharacterized protein YndB with AHSA1/START domain
VKAKPEAMWAALTTGDGVCTIVGACSIEAADRKRPMAKVGDSVRAKAGNDGGNLVVSHVKPNKELRVAWEQDAGGYLCVFKFVLTPTPQGTRVEFVDRYTDDSPKVDDGAKWIVDARTKSEQAFRKLLPQ